MKQLDEYNIFNDLRKNVIPPDGYKKIKVHLIYDIKHNIRHNERCVADRNLTGITLGSVYSGVVSLHGLHMMIFFAELNQLDPWETDIGNSYLEAKISETFYITAGQEFGEKQGNILLIYKELYGLRSSGSRWHEKFSGDLRNMGFSP